MKNGKKFKFSVKSINFLSKIENPKKFFLFFACVFVLVTASVYLWQHYNSDKKIYEAAVMVRDQYNSDPAEDARSSMKIGDVLVIKESGLEWSKTEEVSYLILKMHLTEKQAQDLTSPETREVKRPEPTADELASLSPEEQERLKKERQEPDFETVRPRKYRIDMKKLKDFDPIDLLNEGQPYSDKIFDWGIVSRK